MIDRKLVDKLRAVQPGGNAGAAREAGELPWVEPAGHLLKMWTAPTLEEFDRLAEGFPAAFRRLRSIVMTQRQVPEKHDGWHLRDPNLQAALVRISAAAMGANCGDPFGDREAFERRGAMAAKFNSLFLKLRFRPR